MRTKKESGLWTIPDLRDGFTKFKEDNGHYPSATEIDSFEFLPTSRSIQRSYGGVVGLRKLLNIPSADMRGGAGRSAVATALWSKRRENRRKVYAALVERYGENNVSRRHNLGDWCLTVDFYITDTMAVDVLDVKNTQSLKGCVAAKMKKLKGNLSLLCGKPIIFISMNDGVDVCDGEGFEVIKWEEFRRRYL